MEDANNDIEEFNSDDVETIDDEIENKQEVNIVSFDDIKKKKCTEKNSSFFK